MKTRKLLGLVAMATLTTTSFSQNWITGGNAPRPGPQCVDGTNNILGPQANVPIRIQTNGIQRAIVTTGAPLSSWAGNFGDGLRIIAAGGTNAHLDLFTSNTNGGSETHARFGGSGQVSGR